MSTDRIITNKIWSQVTQILGKHCYKLAAIAYVSKGTPLSFQDGDTLVCDASDQAIKSGETDAKTIKKFFNAGAKLYSCQNLHAKLLISNGLTVIGSANLSASSENILIEAALLTTRSQIRSQVSALIHNIIKASIPIDEDFLDHIVSIPVSVRQWPIGYRKKKTIEEVGNKYWVVNTIPIISHEDEVELVEEGEAEARNLAEDTENEIYWIRWTGTSKFRQLAKPGDTVIEISRNKKRAVVLSPRPILIRQDHSNWTRFYLEDQSDSEQRSWTQFEKELRKVGLQSIKRGSTRELKTREITLMESIWRTNTGI